MFQVDEQQWKPGFGGKYMEKGVLSWILKDGQDLIVYKRNIV